MTWWYVGGHPLLSPLPQHLGDGLGKHEQERVTSGWMTYLGWCGVINRIYSNRASTFFVYLCTLPHNNTSWYIYVICFLSLTAEPVVCVNRHGLNKVKLVFPLDNLHLVQPMMPTVVAIFEWSQSLSKITSFYCLPSHSNPYYNESHWLCSVQSLCYIYHVSLWVDCKSVSGELSFFKYTELLWNPFSIQA